MAPPGKRRDCLLERPGEWAESKDVTREHLGDEGSFTLPDRRSGQRDPTAYGAGRHGWPISIAWRRSRIC